MDGITQFFPSWFELVERDLARRLDVKALNAFGIIERICLMRSMERCGLTKLPDPTSDCDRCSGDAICEVCNQPFSHHPMDWRVIGYGEVPFLNILCDGRRVKL